MPPGIAGSGRTGGFAVRLAVATASFVALAAAVLGLPYVLIKVAGNPLPDDLPAPDEIWSALITPDRGGLFLGALTIVAWAAWLTFVVSVLVEIPAQLRGRRTVRLPGLGAQQRLAAVLVGAILAIVLSPAVSNASTLLHRIGPAPTPIVASAVAVPEVEERVTAVAAYASSLPHTVQSGESLLSVAERYGVSYQVLAQANYGVAQPDGRSLEPSVNRVYPGWTLTVPGVSQVTTQGLAQAQEQQMYEVVRGDWLGCIAERYLGDFNRYPEIADLNRHVIADPDHIEPAWQLALPADAHDRGPREHATGAIVGAGASADPEAGPPANQGEPSKPTPQPSASAQQPAPPPGAAAQPSAPQPSAPQPSPSRSAAAQLPVVPPTTVTPAPAPTASPTPASSATPTPSASPSQTPLAVAPAPAAPDAGQTEGGADEAADTRTGAIVLGAAGLLAALAFAAVRVRRRTQQQHHRSGYRAVNPMEGEIETDLRVAQQPYNVDRFDASLRFLASRLSQRRDSLPDPVGAVVNGDHLRLLLASACEDPPEPWQDDDDSWLLPGAAEFPSEPGQIAPFPAMAAFGAVDSTHLFLDLERMGLVTLAGDPQRRDSLLRYVASELALNAWSDDVDVILAGFNNREARLLVSLNPDRVRSVGSIAEAASRMSRRVSAATTTLENVGLPDALAGRILDVAADAWMPQILLVADPGPDDVELLQDLVAELGDSGRCAVGVVVASKTDGARLGHWTITVDAAGMLWLPFPLPYPPMVAASLPVKDLERLADIMRSARDDIETVVPPAPEPDDWARGTDAAGGILSVFEGLAEPTQEIAVPRYEEHDDMRDDTGREQVYPMNSGQRYLADNGQRGGHLASGESRAGVDPVVVRGDLAGRVVAAEQRSRDVVTAVVPAQRAHDAQLDDDLRAWREADPSRPCIAILGPVEVQAPGPAPEHRRRFHAEIIVYLAQRAGRGADRDQFEEALWPDRQVKDASRRVAVTRARRWLGETSTGDPWLPDMGSDHNYRLRTGYLLDWHLFRRLRSRAAIGGTSGVQDLRAALELVRGVPLDGADQPFGAGVRNPYSWLGQSDVHPDHLTTAIVDAGHDLARLYFEAGDTAGVRWAVDRVWLADPGQTYDQPWRDMMLAQHHDGQFEEVRATFGELMRLRNAEVPEDLAPDTYQLALRLLPELGRAESTHRG